MQRDGRKHPVHLATRERFKTAIIVFVTLCTKDRKRILAQQDIHELLRKTWMLHNDWLVGRYVLMPDHLHLFCAPGTMPRVALDSWVKRWKSHTARFWPYAADAPVWQRHFWARQLRRGESYAAKWAYVLANPLRANLVSRVSDWPYQGELNELRW